MLYGSGIRRGRERLCNKRCVFEEAGQMLTVDRCREFVAQVRSSKSKEKIVLLGPEHCVVSRDAFSSYSVFSVKNTVSSASIFQNSLEKSWYFSAAINFKTLWTCARLSHQVKVGCDSDECTMSCRPFEHRS